MFLIALLDTLHMCGDIFFNYRMMFLWFRFCTSFATVYNTLHVQML